MAGFAQGGVGQFGWAELNTRAIDKALPFYKSVFGWDAKKSAASAGGMDYTEFQDNGQSFAGAMPMPPMVPAGVPSYWLIYFNSTDVDATVKTAKSAGAEELMAPTDFPGGRFAVLRDPQGAVFGVLKMRGA
ncbi:MAG: VOC family protein [Chloroflexi bacterium]|nr:VOC family protein [Chloroflexota bacterium]